MRPLARATWVELAKLRRTLAVGLVPVPPGIVLAMAAVNVLSRGPGFAPAGGLWAWLSPITLVLWCLLALPLFVTLETALLAGVEHRGNTWRHLFALPVPRWTIYAAKLLVGAGLVLLSSAVYWAGIGLLTTMLTALQPELGATAVPWADVARQAGLTFAAVWLAVALQTWVAVRWPSFTVATGIGVAGTLVGFILGIAHASAYVAQYVPWTAPYFAVARGGEDQPVALALGIGGGVLVSILGAWDTNRREIF